MNGPPPDLRGECEPLLAGDTEKGATLWGGLLAGGLSASRNPEADSLARQAEPIRNTPGALIPLVVRTFTGSG